jgi:hypothetical protein
MAADEHPWWRMNTQSWRVGSPAAAERQRRPCLSESGIEEEPSGASHPSRLTENTFREHLSFPYFPCPYTTLQPSVRPRFPTRTPRPLPHPAPRPAGRSAYRPRGPAHPSLLQPVPGPGLAPSQLQSSLPAHRSSPPGRPARLPVRLRVRDGTDSHSGTRSESDRDSDRDSDGESGGSSWRAVTADSHCGQ